MTEEPLREWRRLLKPDGVLVVFVPAFQMLWSKHDEANNHFRRYNRAQLDEALARCGFRVERGSYWNCLLFLPILTARAFKRILPGKKVRISNRDLSDPSPLTNRWLGAMLTMENQLMSCGVDFPFGVSVMAIARKRASA